MEGFFIFRAVIFCVYIIYSVAKDVYYKGFIADLAKRLSKRSAGESHYTSTVAGWDLGYSKEFETKTEALKEEKRLKRLNRLSIESLIKK